MSGYGQTPKGPGDDGESSFPWPSEGRDKEPGPEGLGQIGPYKLLDKLGEGGFGIVYRAQQREPVRRQVALKVIKPGMDTKQVIARFEAERQALAILDHPNIAHVFDGGTTPEGRPYFVMEYIKGIPITSYCDQEKLTIEDRLRLFLPVCEAVQHAHQKGIIHRDLKPSNILVTTLEGKPVPVVIDFGVAKALSQPLTERTLLTGQDQRLGTPEYMSPEQARTANPDIDTRSDVYSLGVLLYELLTGALPFDRRMFEKAAVEEFLRIVREEEPPRPSTRLSSLGDKSKPLAASRGTDTRTLTRRLSQELEWIPLKAMRKERNHRYRSVSDLAEDIQNYLDGKPLMAGPESVVYRTRKLLRRHRALVGGTVAVLLTLTAGIVVSTLLALGQARARAESERQARVSRLVVEFLNNDLLASVDPAVALGQEITVREALDAASKKIEGAFTEEPLVEAAVHYTLGVTYLHLSQYSEAEKHLQRTLELRRTLLGERHRETIEAMKQLARFYTIQRRISVGDLAGMYGQILAAARSIYGKDDPNLLSAINDFASLCEDDREQRQLIEEAIEISRRIYGNGDSRTFEAMEDLAKTYDVQDVNDSAELLLVNALRIWPVETMKSSHMRELAEAYLKQGGPEGGMPLREALRNAMRHLLAPEQILSWSQWDRGAYLRQAGPEERVQLREALQNAARHLRAKGITPGQILSLAQWYSEAEENELAAELLQEGLGNGASAHAVTDRTSLDMMKELAAIRRRQGQREEGEHLYRAWLDAARRVYGEDDKYTLEAMIAVAEAYHDDPAHYAEAEQLYRAALAKASSIPGEDSWDMERVQENLKFIHILQGLDSGSDPNRENAEEILTTPPFYGQDIQSLIWALRGALLWRHYHSGLLEFLTLWVEDTETRDPKTIQNRQPILAIPRSHPQDGKAVVELWKRLVRENTVVAPLSGGSGASDVTAASIASSQFTDHPATLAGMVLVAEDYMDAREYKIAVQWFETAISRMRRVLGRTHHDTLVTEACLGLFHLYRRDPDAAEPLLAGALSQARESLGQDHPDTCCMAQGLTMLYLTGGRAEEAESLIFDSISRMHDETWRPVIWGLGRAVDGFVALCGHRGVWDRAVHVQRKWLDTVRTARGVNDYATVQEVTDLTQLYIAADHDDEARQLLLEWEHLLDWKNPALARWRYLKEDFAQLYQEVGRYDRAGQLLLDLVDASEEDFASTWRIRALAEQYHMAGRDDEEGAFLLEFVRTGMERCGENHPTTRKAVEEVALHILCRHFEQGCLEVGERILTRVLESWPRSALDDDSFRHAMSFLINRHDDALRWHRVAALRQKLLAASQSVYGDEHPTTIEYIDNLAWLRASCPEAEVRDGLEAIANATKACELTQWKDPALMNTLAAAYAEAGDFAAASTWQTKAIGLLPTKDRARIFHESRLQRYQAGQPYHKWQPYTGLIGYWMCNDTAEKVIADSSGSRIEGQCMGDAHISADPQKGRVLELDGMGDWVDCGRDERFDVTGRITVCAWIKVRTFNKPWQAIVTKGDTAWRLQRDGENNSVEFVCTGVQVEGTQGGRIAGSTDVNDGQWHHVAGVYDGEKIYLCVDGRLDASANASGQIGVNDFPVLIGANTQMEGREWDGWIDDVRVYNDILAPFEIETTLGDKAVLMQTNR